MLWLGFGAIYTKSFGALQNRLFLLVVIGAIGGPMAYLGGAEMDAMQIGTSKIFFVLMVGLEWACALPLLMWCSKRYEKNAVTTTSSKIV